MRGKHKDSIYFKEKITKLLERIHRTETVDYISKVKDISSYQATQSIFYNHLLKLSYSLESSQSDLFNYFQKSFHYFAQSYGEGEGIADIIDYLSLAVLFDEHKSEFIDDINLLLEKYSDLADNDLVQTDDFISILFHYLLTGEVRAFNAYYEYLNMIENDFESVKKAQGFWYYAHADAPWYNSHKYDNRGYVGYWSFDTAALCKMRGIFDERLKELDYFPYDLLVQS